MNKSSKKSIIFIIVFMICAAAVSIACASLVVYIDPYMHYHAPIQGKNYILKEQRYLNDGIVKNCDYDAMICGSSMTECFRPSVMDSYFGTKGIKVPFSGGSYREVGDLLRTACASNPNLKMVIRGLDCNRFFDSKDERDYDEDTYPIYLYDNNIFNDVKYVFSKDAIIDSALILIHRGEAAKPSSFDTYSNWNGDYVFGKNTILASYSRDDVETPETENHLSEEDKALIKENITANVTDIAALYPNVEFNIYFTPYSIYYIDFYKKSGELQRQIEAEKYISSLLLECDNINVYSFYLKSELIENPDYYKDLAHHGQDASDMIIGWIYNDEGLITKDNIDSYYDELIEYYSNLDFDIFF
ncbi:MAG: hypothetical protein K5776_03115 [Lachnospiraceae bacterium]|nr:hypothetical protein [Lachnospiraceae bacterium]